MLLVDTPRSKVGSMPLLVSVVLQRVNFLQINAFWRANPRLVCRTQNHVHESRDRSQPLPPLYVLTNPLLRVVELSVMAVVASMAEAVAVLQ